MEKPQDTTTKTADGEKLPLANELLSKTTLPETPKYDFAPETHLNPGNIGTLPESKPENKIEGLNVSARYQEMINGVIMEKVLRPNMNEEEIRQLADEMVREFEVPATKEAEQEDFDLLARETAENQKKTALLGQENKISPISRAIELISGWLSKHPIWAKTAMGAVVASELAGCATGGGYYGGGAYAAQSIITTGMYGAESAVRTGMYGMQSAETTARYGEASAQNLYNSAMNSEEMRYRQDLAGLERFTGQVKQGEEQLYRQLQMTEDPRMRGALQQQINNLENQFLQRGAQIESYHQQMIANIQNQVRNQMANTQNGYRNMRQNTQTQVGYSIANTGAQAGIQLFNLAIGGLLHQGK